MFYYGFKICVFLMGTQKGRTCSALDKVSLGRAHGPWAVLLSEAEKVLGKAAEGPGTWIFASVLGRCSSATDRRKLNWKLLQVWGGLSYSWRFLQWKTKAIQETACCQQLPITSANFRAWKHHWQCDFWNMGSVYSCNLYHICVRNFIAVTCRNLHCFIITSLN